MRRFLKGLIAAMFRPESYGVPKSHQDKSAEIAAPYPDKERQKLNHKRAQLRISKRGFA